MHFQRDEGFDNLVGRATDGYVVMEKVGSGAFSSVYKAMETAGEKRLVALKVMHEIQQRMTGPGQVEHPFERELRLSRVVKDPGIARVYKTGQLRDGRYYAALEYVDAMTLEGEIAHRRVIPWVEAVAVITAAGRSVASLHAEGIIHRDLKPGNVMVRLGKDGRIHVKLIDLGTARLAHERDSAEDGVAPGAIGSPQYMAPEQATGAGTSKSTDVYALGAILYEMVTGRPVLALKRPVADVCIAYLESDRPIPSIALEQLVPDAFPAALRGVIEGALARDPAQRPRDAAAFVAQVEAAAAEARERGASGSGLGRLGAMLKGLFGRKDAAASRPRGRFNQR